MPPDKFAEFKTLVEDNKQRSEKECAAYLSWAIEFLLPTPPVSFDTVEEVPNYFGRTDFIIAADILDDQNQPKRCVYIWELKAPQCYVFEPDQSNTRYRPTKDFIKAENQLLHYADEAIGSARFRSRFRVLEQEDIKLGGIIIGRSGDRLFSGASSALAIENARTAFKVRDRYLYGYQGIRVLFWDRVLNAVAPE